MYSNFSFLFDADKCASRESRLMKKFHDALVKSYFKTYTKYKIPKNVRAQFPFSNYSIVLLMSSLMTTPNSSKKFDIDCKEKFWRRPQVLLTRNSKQLVVELTNYDTSKLPKIRIVLPIFQKNVYELISIIVFYSEKIMKNLNS